ncbi:uncharacterized protein LOC111261825, partial [Varroa jacobsoni]|uniref:uncharacterized protein LOC111261825 n=1 Tax=Varroa jacobsoni TaxID=62625 RepID=UPI000BF9EFCE
MKLKHVSVLIENPNSHNFLTRSKNARNNLREIKEYTGTPLKSVKRGSKGTLKPNGYFDSGLVLEKHDEVDSDIDVNFDDLEDLGEGIEETVCYSPAFSASDTCGGLSLSSTATNESEQSSPSFQSKSSQNFSQRRLIHVDLMFSDDELEDSESNASSLTKHPSIEFLSSSSSSSSS